MGSKAKLEAVISADARAFYRTMGSVAKDARVLAGGVGTGMAAGASAVVAAWAYALKSLVEYGSAVTDLSQRTGLGTDFLQELGYAAKQTGAEMADVEPAVKALANALQGAGKGGAAAAAFRDLGLSWQNLATQTPDQQLAAVLSALGRVSDPAKRTALAVDLLGRSGMKLIPLASQFDQLVGEARAMGIVLSGDTIRSADDLGDAVSRLGARVRGAAFGAVAPDLARFSDALNSIAMDPALWEAFAPALRQVSQAIGDFGMRMAELLKDPATLQTLATSAQNLADGFTLAADGAAKLLETVKPLLDFMNEAQAGWEWLFERVGYGRKASGVGIENLNRYTGAQLTQAAVELRNRGVTMDNTSQDAYLQAMANYLAQIAGAVTPLGAES